MRKAIFALFAFFALMLLSHEAKAQFSGCGAGFCTASPASAPVGCTPTCPGDILSYKVWYGFRCDSFAYSGFVADIVDSATGNTIGARLKCTSGVMNDLTSGSSCPFVTGGLCSDLSTVCATACKLAVWYDQSGSNACTGGVPCDLIQATNANRPDISLSPAVCSNYTVTEGMQAANALTASTTQPFTVTSIWNATVGGATRSALGNTSSGVIFGQEFTAGNVFAFAGSAAEAAVPTNLWHAIIAVVNGSSTSITVDGAMSSGLSAGAGAFDGTIATGVDTFSGFVGPICEEGLAAGDQTALIAALNTNMHAAYGGWPSNPIIASACTPTCPGDLVLSSITWKVWYATHQCFTFAYSGNVVDVWDAATGNTTETLITCSGGVVSETINPLATTCAISCEIATLYDQTGALACAGSSNCDVTNVHGDRPSVTLNSLNTVACAAFNGISGGDLSSANNLTLAEPLSGSLISQRTGNTGIISGVIRDGGNSFRMGYSSSVDTAGVYDFGSMVATNAASDSAFHALAYDINTTTPLVFVDGSSTGTSGGLNGGVGFAGVPIAVGFRNPNGFVGLFCEGGMMGGDIGGTDAATLSMNQHARYGGW